MPRTSRLHFLAFALLTLCLVSLGSAQSTYTITDLGTLGGSISSLRSGATKPKVADAYGKLPLSFEANQGQSDAQVKFLSRGGGYTLFLTSTESMLVLQKGAPSSGGSQHVRESGSSLHLRTPAAGMTSAPNRLCSESG